MILTGSRAYGTPHEFSDIDVVVFVTPETEELLRRASGGYRGIKFGLLNLITCTDPVRYEVWLRVTTELIAMKPVTREFAINKFAENGIEPWEYK